MRISRKILLFATILVASAACGETSQPLSPDVAAPRLAITGLVIQGPSAVTRWEECTFRAVASGGTAPYTYAWSVQNGQGTADGVFWTGFTWTTTMTLTVTATDALGATRTFTKNVAGVYSAPPCV
jgi:hypothetical protein